MTRALALRVAAAAALLNLALGGLVGWWLYRFAPWVPIAGSAGAIADTLISAFLIAFCAWWLVAPSVEHQVTQGLVPARIDPPASPLGRFARLRPVLRALVCGAACALALGAPAALALALTAPAALSLAAFLAWKAAFAAVAGGMVTPLIAWASETAQPGLVKAVPRFPVLDLAAALEFYEKQLGFQRLFLFPDYAGVARSGFELHLFVVSDPALPLWTSCRVNVRGLDALYQEYLRAGVVHASGRLEHRPWGFREFTAVDLFGNALVFAEWFGAGPAR
ncbi:MAG TPA: glyoxalase superfamily protein [Myxococcota bacterium]|nr:glyoxalase superfamily protein [Myxococcota bacterium]